MPWPFYGRCLVLAIGALLIAIVALTLAREYRARLLASALVLSSLPYLLFAAYSQCNVVHWQVEATGTLLFLLIALLGAFKGLRYLAWGWLMHPLWDLGLHWQTAQRPSHCALYVVSCALFDVLLAATILRRERTWRTERASRGTF